MQRKTVVLPSARSIRDAIANTPKNGFLDNYITMGEFLSKSLIAPNLSFIDEDTRIVLLLEASNFESFAKLQIKRNFFAFTKNASYIFSFFEELSSEQVPLEALQNSDVYGEYEEHLDILTTLLQNYEALCLKHNLVDKIFLEKYYTLNEAYIKALSDIEIHIEGLLTNFELEVLEKMSKIQNVHLIVSTTRFNTKMVQKLKKFGFDLKKNYIYKLALHTKTIIEQTKQDVQLDVELFAR